MAKIAKSRTSPHFEKKFNKLPRNLQKIVAKKLLLFENNPSHPGLNTHKLKGELSSFWSFYINNSLRVLVRFIHSDEVIYYDIDTHDIYK